MQATQELVQLSDRCLSNCVFRQEGETKIIEVNSKSGEERTIKPHKFEVKYEQFKSASLTKGQDIEGTLE